MRRIGRNFFNRFPLLKGGLIRIRDRLRPGTSVSSHFVALADEQTGSEGQRLRNAWRDDGLPSRQRALVDQQLQQYRRGKRVDVFDTLVAALRALPNLRSTMSLLEIGCSSGYYSEVISIAELPFLYTGCDYSAPFIKMAREQYPSLEFHVADATDLPFPDGSFDVVVSGCCLLHIPEFKKAISETARICRSYAIFHRTPVVWGQPNQWFRKQAYGIETVEIHFNEDEFLVLLEAAGLTLIATYTLYEENSVEEARGQAVRTYLCQKTMQ